MRAGLPYNSGLAKPSLIALREQLGATEYAASARGVVFIHAVGMPYRPGEIAIISACAECIYCEVPWPRGWALFHERAGTAPIGTHAEYIAAVKSTILDAFKKPAFIICSKHDAGLLGQSTPQPIRLNGERAWLATSHAEEIPAADGTTALLGQLAQRYRSVYDFGCGYGNALRPFAYAVGSDIDQKCLDYIAREIL